VRLERLGKLKRIQWPSRDSNPRPSSFQRPVFKHPQPVSFPSYERPTGKITVLCVSASGVCCPAADNADCRSALSPVPCALCTVHCVRQQQRSAGPIECMHVSYKADFERELWGPDWTSCFASPPQANAGHDLFQPHHIQLNIQWSSYHSTLCKRQLLTAL
jgi:hypothetical protein